MGWVKIDDGLCTHVKTFTMLDLESIGLWTLCLAFCAHELTDGFVPEEYVTARVARDDPHGTCHKLIAAGWMKKVDGGYVIPQYLDYNPSKAETEENRERVHKQRSDAGKRGAAARWGGKTDGKGDGTPPSPRQARRHSTVHGPVPLPLKKKSSKEDQESTDGQRVFAHWQQTLSPGARFTQGRRDKVRARLKNYPAERILRAIDGCAASEFHTANGHIDLTLICRSDEKLEEFEAKPLRVQGVRAKDGTQVRGPGLLSDRTECKDCAGPIGGYEANNQSGLCSPCYEKRFGEAA